MARLSIDTPQIQGNELDRDLNHWFTTTTDTLNTNFGNIIADRTPDIVIQSPSWGTGAGPYSVPVIGLLPESIVTANIQSSSNAVAVAKVTATALGFDILFTGDPGAHCFVNYIVFINNWAAQGV